MKKFFIRISILLAVLLTGYFIWSLTGRATEKESGWSKNPEFKVRFEYVEQGADSGKGNLIGIQPYLTAVNYSTAYNFETSLRFYFEQLKREGKLNSKTVVVLPEHIGTWLVLANEKESVYKAESLQEAFKSIRSASVFSYLNAWFKSPETDKNRYAIFHIKAAKMAMQYTQVFATLAKDYKCSIAAGSMLLPDAQFDSSNSIQLKPHTHLYNTYFLFDSSGAITQPVTKIKTDSKKPQLMDIAFTKQFITVKDGKISWVSVEDGSIDSAKSNRLSINNQLSNVQQGLFIDFNGNLFNQQYNGKLQLIKNDSAIVFPASTGKGRIVCLWLK